MEMTDKDRRRHARLPLGCAVKVYDPFSRRYRAGVTRNVSTGGALIELHGALYARPGQKLGLAIDWTASRPLMSQGDLMNATVVRCDTSNGLAPVIAVQFATSIPLAAAA
jgi:hypothetical protein